MSIITRRPITTIEHDVVDDVATIDSQMNSIDDHDDDDD